MRLFVALDIPDSFRRRLVDWRDRSLAGRRDLRPIAPEALHVTLCFLGWRAEGEVQRIASAMLEATAGAPAPVLAPARVVAVPPWRPRLFALDLTDEGGSATALQASVSGALAAAGAYEPEVRPFWPHLTLARVRRGARAAPSLGAALAGMPVETFTAPTLTLYRSTLRPQGALYEPLTVVRLAP